MYSLTTRHFLDKPAISVGPTKVPLLLKISMKCSMQFLLVVLAVMYVYHKFHNTLLLGYNS